MNVIVAGNVSGFDVIAVDNPSQRICLYLRYLIVLHILDVLCGILTINGEWLEFCFLLGAH